MRRRRRGSGYGTNVLVVSDGVVLCNLSQGLVALSAKDGKRLWGYKKGAGFHAPMDVFVIDSLVWPGSHPKDSVAPPPVDDFSVALDLHTGAVRKTNNVMVDLQTAGHHHRCYRNKATTRYIIAGKRGVEMMDLNGQNHSRNNWIRGTCQYGMMPANGLTYVPPHSCGCYPESKLWGFYALNDEQPALEKAVASVEQASRLEKGPAYGKMPSSAGFTEAQRRPSPSVKAGLPASPAASGADWPQYRHDALRSGVAGASVPAELEKVWQIDIGGKPTQPVIAQGKVVEVTLHARVQVRVPADIPGDVHPHHPAAILFGYVTGRLPCAAANVKEVAALANVTQLYELLRGLEAAQVFREAHLGCEVKEVLLFLRLLAFLGHRYHDIRV